MKSLLNYGNNAPKPPESQQSTEQQQVGARRTPAAKRNYLAAPSWALVSSTVTSRHDEQLVYRCVLRKCSTPYPSD